MFLTQLDALIYDTAYAELSQNDRYRDIVSAVEMYSHDFPDHETDDVTGDAGRYYAIATVMDQWEEGFSRIEAIEYPAPTIASDESPVYLGAEDWNEDYWASDLRYLFLPNHAPAATEKMRIRYTVPYKWVSGTETTSVVQATHGFSVNDYLYLSSSTWYEAEDIKEATHQVSAVADTGNFTVKILATTIPPNHFFAVCHLAASLCCRAMATKYAHLGDSVIAADSTAHAPKGEAFAARAADFYDLYRQALGLMPEEDGGAVEPAGEFVDLDTAPGWPGGRQFLFRGKGLR